jgi:hypothetical protein
MTRWPPNGDPTEPDALSAFLDRTRPWGRTQVPLRPAVSIALWVLAAVDVLAGTAAAAVLTGALPCSMWICEVATLGNPQLMVTLAACGALGLIGTATVTGGLTRTGGGQLATLTAASLLGAGAVLGTVLALMVIAVAVAFAIGLIIAFVES